MTKKRISIRFIGDADVAYLKARIEGGHPKQAYKALQELCRLYRTGFRLRPSHLVAVEQSIVGLLYTQGHDEKVRRWALNALARLGREATCLEAVLHVLSLSSNEPQVAASAIAAIYRLSRRASEILRKQAGFDQQMATLASTSACPASTAGSFCVAVAS
jgi:hypothetical protein